MASIFSSAGDTVSFDFPSDIKDFSHHKRPRHRIIKDNRLRHGLTAAAAAAVQSQPFIHSFIHSFIHPFIRCYYYHHYYYYHYYC